METKTRTGSVKSMENELILAYDHFSDFSPRQYFTAAYNRLPSFLKTKFPLKNAKESSNRALELIDLKQLDIAEIFRYWKTDNTNDTRLEDDFPFYRVFKSNTNKLLFSIEAQEEITEVQFFYDLADKDIENWVLQTNHNLRVHLGRKHSPKFRVLTGGIHDFDTEEVSTLDFKSVDIKEFYNDDLLEINDTIVDSLKRDDSGLILLHGIPGTGKTSYIKHLISTFSDTSFIFIQNEFVKDLLSPSFISFLLENRNSVLIIEDAERVILSREDTSQSSVVSTILQLTDGLFSDFLNIKIICTFNMNIEKIDKALLRKGRMIAKYKFGYLSKDKSKALLSKYDLPQSDERMTLADIFNFDQKEFKNDKKNTIGFTL